MKVQSALIRPSSLMLFILLLLATGVAIAAEPAGGVAITDQSGELDIKRIAMSGAALFGTFLGTAFAGFLISYKWNAVLRIIGIATIAGVVAFFIGPEAADLLREYSWIGNNARSVGEVLFFLGAFIGSVKK